MKPVFENTLAAAGFYARAAQRLETEGDPTGTLSAAELAEGVRMHQETARLLMTLLEYEQRNPNPKE